MNRIEIKWLIPLTERVVLVIFKDNGLGLTDAELVPIGMRINKLLFRPTGDEKRKIECFLREVIRRSRFTVPEKYEEVSVEIEESLYRSMLKWCAEKGIDEKVLIQALFRFVGDPGNREEAKLFLLELQTKSEMEEFAKLDLSSVWTVTREELQKQFELILEKVEAGNSPVLVVAEGKPDLLLFEWGDYWRRFGWCHKKGEREEIEAEARRMYEEGLEPKQE